MSTKIEVRKDFRYYSRKFKKLEGSFLPGETPDWEAAARIIKWQLNDRFTEAYSHEQIAEAVYEADDAEDWQQFRVSLKGFSTQMKLYRLQVYYYMNLTNEHTLIRVNNYLGALKRGGQLNQKLEIMK